mmetsp:Transcript_54453/g.115655  ORF Transcript_54453/g.115655 Transcript_54453/m.115655 type:complete len:267 (-) Transcript_54453:563-1363(-)
MLLPVPRRRWRDIRGDDVEADATVRPDGGHARQHAALRQRHFGGRFFIIVCIISRGGGRVKFNMGITRRVGVAGLPIPAFARHPPRTVLVTGLRGMVPVLSAKVVSLPVVVDKFGIVLWRNFRVFAIRSGPAGCLVPPPRPLLLSEAGPLDGDLDREELDGVCVGRYPLPLVFCCRCCVITTLLLLQGCVRKERRKEETPWRKWTGVRQSPLLLFVVSIGAQRLQVEHPQSPRSFLVPPLQRDVVHHYILRFLLRERSLIFFSLQQ